MNRTIASVQAQIRRNYLKPLEWQPLSAYTLQSTDKVFTLGKLPDSEGVMRYDLWNGKTLIAARLESAQAAKDLAEKHR